MFDSHHRLERIPTVPTPDRSSSGDTVALTDAHCHLEEFDDVAGLVEEAANCGVVRMVAVGQNRGTMKAALDRASEFPGTILPALGIHPVFVTRQSREETEGDIDFLSQHLPSAVAIGEVGLDYKWAESDHQKQHQQELLERQFALAVEGAKPVNLHSRRCPREVMERAIAFHRDSDLNAQLHWFTHSKKLVHICNDEGIFISVGPAIIHEERSQAVAAEIATDLILLETDAPVPIGGSTGHPCRAREVAEKLAELKGMSLPAIAALTEANFSRYLG